MIPYLHCRTTNAIFVRCQDAKYCRVFHIVISMQKSFFPLALDRFETIFFHPKCDSYRCDCCFEWFFLFCYWFSVDYYRMVHVIYIDLIGPEKTDWKCLIGFLESVFLSKSVHDFNITCLLLILQLQSTAELW